MPLVSPSPSVPSVGVPSVLARLEGAAVRIGNEQLLAPVSLSVSPGETIAIVGRSGAGKTTLLHLLAGLLAPSAGTAELTEAALLPQRDGLMTWATARDNAALALRVAGVRRSEARERAQGALEALGVGHLGDRRAATLSGGERQRVALARTLLTGRNLLLLDEPFAALDAITRDELHEVLLAQLGGSRAAVLVTHDLDEAARLGSRLLILGAGGLREPSLALTGQPGQRLAERGGEPLRSAIQAELQA